MTFQLIAFTNAETADQNALILLTKLGGCDRVVIVSVDHFLQNYCWNMYRGIYGIRAFMGTKIERAKIITKDSRTGNDILEFHREKLGPEYCRIQSYRNFEMMLLTQHVIVVDVPENEQYIIRNLGGNIV